MSRFIFHGQRLNEVRFPLGGIGAGNISLDGGARMVDWEIHNRPNKESYNGFSHIAVKAEREGQVLDARVLNGPLRPPYMGKGLHSFGGYGYGPARETMAGVPHFSGVTLTGRFPIAQYDFTGSFPAKASLTAWSPFEPMNDFDSSLPLTMFEIALTNITDEPTDYAVAFTLCNPERREPANRIVEQDGRTALLCDTAAADRRQVSWGQACLMTDEKEVSSQQNWYHGAWFDGLNMFWKDFTSPGRLKPRNLEEYPKLGPGISEIANHGVLCAHVTCSPGETRKVRFVLGWYFPNYEKYWGETAGNSKHPAWRNWYATQFNGALDVAKYGISNWERMYEAADAFVDALYHSSLPEEVIDAAGSTLAVLKSPTCLRLTDGSFYGWEGSHAREGSCEGSCQHVWNYQYALPLLFPALERSMRKLDYQYNIRGNGSVPFRLQLPLGEPPWNFRACADGQLGGIIKSYREWKISGDTAWLRDLWPLIRRSLEYVWSPDNEDRWDPGKTGVLTGRQHHTLDMELFGPNSWLTGIYLAALEAAARMAEMMGEERFAAECRRIKEKGMRYVDEHLFNGEYYFHRIDLGDKSILERYDGEAMGTGNAVKAYWNDEVSEIKYQIGEGSSVDQLLGQWHADLCGLGDLFDPEKIRTALASVYRYNFVPDMTDFFNPCRIYCLQEECGLLICAYPEGRRRPAISAPYAEETMHGFEYSAACHMILRGLEQEGLTCIRAVRDRYNGERRNPWNEIECGGNYARSMAAWSLIPAYQGLSIDMTKKSVRFCPLHPEQEHRSLWTVSAAWGKLVMDARSMHMIALGGSVELERMELPTLTEIHSVTLDDTSIPFTWDGHVLLFSRPVVLGKGSRLIVA